MLILDNLTISYGKKKVIDGLSLNLEAGKVHGLVGLNGSGKTTLLAGIYGFQPLESGGIVFNKEALSGNRISYLETRNYFYPRITGKEYLRLFAGQNRHFDIRGWNEVLALPLDSLIDTYSTGMQKKLAFLAMIAFDHPVLLLDEPFNGLDLESVLKLKLIIKAMERSGKTILITSHILESLTGICHSISCIVNGKIQQQLYHQDFNLLESTFFAAHAKESEERINRLLR